jgi:hypothetical protein
MTNFRPQCHAFTHHPDGTAGDRETPKHHQDRFAAIVQSIYSHSAMRVRGDTSEILKEVNSH